MESHALHGDGIYYESDDTIWVNLFAPSTAAFAIAGAKITTDTSFPDGDHASISIDLPSPKAFTIAVRRPYWAGDGFAIVVNGAPVPQPAIASLRPGAAGGRPLRDAVPEASTFVSITRTWKAGDRIDLQLPKTVRLEPTPDDPTIAAIMWGPLALAANWGPRRDGRRGTAAAVIPVIVTAGAPVESWVTPSGTTPGDFGVKGLARVPGETSTPGDVTLAPFYRTQERNYSIYFDVLTPADFDVRSAEIAAERERTRKLEAATIGFVQPGEMQPERDFHYHSEPADRPTQRIDGRGSRAGGGWFSFDLPVDPSTANAVVVTYENQAGEAPASGNFRILVDGTEVGRFAPTPAAKGFFDVTYPVPAAAVRGKSTVTVRFEAFGSGRIPPVFGVRTVRAGG